ncbi:hypothetical protein QOT17_018770 [Balamuthia mandrillaris]
MKRTPRCFSSLASLVLCVIIIALSAHSLVGAQEEDDEPWEYSPTEWDEEDLYGGTCMPWTASPAHCEQFGYTKGMMIWVPNGISNGTHDFPMRRTMEQMEGRFAGNANSLGLPSIDFDIGPCLGAFLRLLCATWLRPCEVVNGVPKRICTSVCEHAQTTCGPLLQAFGASLSVMAYRPLNTTYESWSCDMTDVGVSPDFEFFSPNQTYPVYNVDKTGTIPKEELYVGEGTCEGVPQTRENIILNCVKPLVYDVEKRFCVFECPLPSLEEEQYDTLKVLQLVLAWLSWASSLFLVLSYGVNANLRGFPSNMVMMTAISGHIAAFAMILPTFAGYQEVWCDGGTTLFPEVHYNMEAEQERGANGGWNPAVHLDVEFVPEDLIVRGDTCSAQGFILMFGFLSGTFWWAITAFNMWFSMMFSKSIPHWFEGGREWIRIGVYHAVAWGIPLLFSIIAVATDHIGFRSSGSFCFITAESGPGYQLGLWAIPVALLLFVGGIFFLLCLYFVTRLAMKASDSASKSKFMAFYIRLLCFLFAFLLIYVCVFAFQLHELVNEDELVAAYEEYYTCLYVILDPDYPGDECTIPEEGTTYALVTLRSVGYCCLGFVLFLNFMSMDIVRHWAKLFRGACCGGSDGGKGEFKLKDWVQRKLTVSRSSTSSASHKSASFRRKTDPALTLTQDAESASEDSASE